jgi:hypothetical protein
VEERSVTSRRLALLSYAALRYPADCSILEHAVLFQTGKVKRSLLSSSLRMGQSKQGFCYEAKTRPDAGTLFEKLFTSSPDAIVVVGTATEAF